MIASRRLLGWAIAGVATKIAAAAKKGFHGEFSISKYFNKKKEGRQLDCASYPSVCDDDIQFYLDGRWSKSSHNVRSH